MLKIGLIRFAKNIIVMKNKKTISYFKEEEIMKEMKEKIKIQKI